MASLPLLAIIIMINSYVLFVQCNGMPLQPLIFNNESIHEVQYKMSSDALKTVLFRNVASTEITDNPLKDWH